MPKCCVVTQLLFVKIYLLQLECFGINNSINLTLPVGGLFDYHKYYIARVFRAFRIWLEVNIRNFRFFHLRNYPDVVFRICEICIWQHWSKFQDPFCPNILSIDKWIANVSWNHRNVQIWNIIFWSRDWNICGNWVLY